MNTEVFIWEESNLNCSNVMNIATFQVPRRMKEGTNPAFDREEKKDRIKLMAKFISRVSKIGWNGQRMQIIKDK